MAIDRETLARIHKLERQNGDLIGILISVFGCLSSLWSVIPTTKPDDKTSKALDEIAEKLDKLIDGMNKPGGSDG